MADITVTAANVARVDGEVETRYAGGTITAGQPVRVSTSGTVVATSDDSAANAAAAGIALNGGAAGQPITYLTNGIVAIGGTVSVGKAYVVSTSGGIAPVDDIAGGEYITILGGGITTAQIQLSINRLGVAAAAAVS